MQWQASSPGDPPGTAPADVRATELDRARPNLELAPDPSATSGWEPDLKRAPPHPDPVPDAPPGAGWHPDPLDPGRRLRWWDGDAWTARVVSLEVGSHAISWHHRMGEHSAPTAVAAPPIAPAGADVVSPPEAIPPDTADEVVELDDSADHERPRTRRRVLTLVAAALLLIAAAAGASAAMLGGPERPTVAPTVVYRDRSAGFSFKYPDRWAVTTRTPGEGVRFTVGAKGATPLETNTISVVAGTTPGQPLPALHLLLSDTTAQLIAERPDIRLVSAVPAHLADAPAYRLEFSDSSTSPATRIVQVVGRTTSGRPLLVSLVIREPRTAPSARAFARFVASIVPD